MNSEANFNNERLKELVRASGHSTAVALTLFNRGLGGGAHSMDSWNGYFARPDAKEFHAISDDLLRHAEIAFAGRTSSDRPT